MCISSQLCPVLVTIDVTAIAKSWNVLTGGSNFFKESFLTKDMKSIIMAWVRGEVSESDPFPSISDHNFSSSVPSCDLTLFLKEPSLSKKNAGLVIPCWHSSMVNAGDIHSQ